MNRPHFYYSAPASSNVGLQLHEFMQRCDDASETARQWAEKQGATSYIESPEGMAGGIAALEIENCLGRDGFERIVMPNGNVIFMPEPDSDLEKEMYALPIVSEAELISILHFESKKDKNGRTLPFTFGNETPVVFLYEGAWYIDVPYACNAEELTQIHHRNFSHILDLAMKSQ